MKTPEFLLCANKNRIPFIETGKQCLVLNIMRHSNGKLKLRRKIVEREIGKPKTEARRTNCKKPKYFLCLIKN